MDKLIITATCIAKPPYPAAPHDPRDKGFEEVAREYVRCAAAGAAVTHLHGPQTIDETIQADGSRLSVIDIPGWQKLRDNILSNCETIMQYGIANARFPHRKQLMREQRPDMISTCFVAHDECFDYDEGYPVTELYGIHNREELSEYCKVTNELGIKIEAECFHYGGVWNALRFVNQGLLAKPVWITFFLGWRGGCWTPPTYKALQYMHDHLPEGFNYNTSVMDPEMHWKLLTMAILLGGHVRVGMEDNPYLAPGEYATSNAQLVEKIVRISRELGREIATPTEARKIIGLA